MLKRIDGSASAIVAATPTVASRYKNPRTTVVGNETRLGTFANCRPSRAARSVLFTGTVGVGHLFPDVVAAIKDLPDVKLTVAGRQPDANTWAAAKLTLGDRLVHLGWLDRSGLAAAMSASSLGLLTYADTETYSVASPTKGFEFAAAGLPIVATPNKMNREALHRSKAGFLTDDFSVASIRAAIEMALSSEASWQAASRAGREWAAREGSWERSEQRLLWLYADLLGTAP